MRGNPLMLLTAVFILGFAGLAVPSSTAQVSAGTSTLQGLVCALDNIYYYQPPDQSCAYSNGGLPNATVHLTMPGVVGPIGAVDKTDLSDPSGFFEFTQLPDGEMTLSVSRDGFEDASVQVTVSGATYQDVILAGKVVTVTGKVLSEAGAAIPGAVVSACCSGNEGPAATTASDGGFSVQTVAGFRSFSITQARGFQELYESRFVDGTQTLEFRLVPVPPQDARLVGRATDQDGNPIAGLQVFVYSYPAYDYAYAEPARESSSSDAMVASSPAYYPYYGGSNYTVTDSDGRYEIRVYGGSSASVSAGKEGYASFNAYPSVGKGETVTLDIVLRKFPDKTARIEGKVVDATTGDPIPYFSVSVRSPLYGLYECSQEEAQGGGSSGGTPTAIASDGRSASMPYPYYNPGCAITVHPDGTFEGTVTPGYTILQVYADSWRACAETRDADGSTSRSCGPEYLSWIRTLDMPADDTTTVTVAMQQRPAPDAVVSGYLVDAETGKAIANAQISFSNEETYAYGYAQTDADGSYKLRLRHGYHSVYAYAEGHLTWQGNLVVKEGEQPFDVELTPGQESYGGCYGCYGCCYAYDTVAASEGGKAAGAPAMASAPSGMQSRSEGGQAYEDLGGGLGPYDAAARARLMDAKGSPNLQLALVLGVLAVGAVLVRRKLD